MRTEGWFLHVRVHRDTHFQNQLSLMVGSQSNSNENFGPLAETKIEITEFP